MKGENLCRHPSRKFFWSPPRSYFSAPVFRLPMIGIQGRKITIQVGMTMDASLKNPAIVILNTEPIITSIEIPDTPIGTITKITIIRKGITGLKIITAINKDIQPVIYSFSVFRCGKFCIYGRDLNRPPGPPVGADREGRSTAHLITKKGFRPNGWSRALILLVGRDWINPTT